jgi:hypothetical protein
MVNINTKEAKMAIPSHPHSELDVLTDTVKVVKEVNQPAWAIWPNKNPICIP